MRTILFKAKKLSDDEWVKGYLVKSPFGTFIEWYDDSICNKEEVDNLCSNIFCASEIWLSFIQGLNSFKAFLK